MPLQSRGPGIKLTRLALGEKIGDFQVIDLPEKALGHN
jgi:hypothetical protein